MSDSGANSDLERALQLSLDLLTVAERGDVRALADLDAERLRLLHSVSLRFRQMDGDERLMLQKITELNDQAIGFLEHRRRRTERHIDMAVVGRRALVAYSSTG